MPTNTLQGYDIYDFSSSTGSVIYGGDDWDTVDFTYARASTGVTLTFSGDNAFDYTLDGTTATGSGNTMEYFTVTHESDVVDASNDATGATYVLWGGDDIFTGGSGNVSVFGGDGNDTISTGPAMTGCLGGLAMIRSTVASGMTPLRAVRATILSCSPTVSAMTRSLTSTSPMATRTGSRRISSTSPA